MNKCIIIANGETPNKSIVNFFLSKGYNKIFAADGGFNTAIKLNIIPDYVIGDLDSADKNLLNEILNRDSGKLIVKKIKRQNDTDLEKCLKFIIKMGFSETVILGAIGKRLDHTICNLGILLKFSSQMNISLVAENSFLKVYSGNVELKTIKDEIISVYAFDKKTLITSKGLKYPLKKSTLPFGEKESTSNVATSDKIFLQIEGGKIFLIRDFSVVKKYGLI